MDLSNVMNFISNNVPLVIDIALVIVLIICAVRGYIVGFLASAFDLIGSLGGVIGAWYVSSHYTKTLFDSFLRETMIDRSYNYLVKTAEGMSNAVKEIDVGTALSGVLGNWFNTFAENTIQRAQGTLSTMLQPTMESAVYLVDEFVSPIVVSVMSLLIFVICFLIIKLVCSLLSNLTKGVNEVPVIGTANQALGFVSGIVIGVVYIILLSFLFSIIVMVTKDSLTHFNGRILSKSIILRLTAFLNPFLQ